MLRINIFRIEYAIDHLPRIGGGASARSRPDSDGIEPPLASQHPAAQGNNASPRSASGTYRVQTSDSTGEECCGERSRHGRYAGVPFMRKFEVLVISESDAFWGPDSTYLACICMDVTNVLHHYLLRSIQTRRCVGEGGGHGDGQVGAPLRRLVPGQHLLQHVRSPDIVFIRIILLSTRCLLTDERQTLPILASTSNCSRSSRTR